MSPELRRNLRLPLRVEVRRGGAVTVEYAINVSLGGMCLQASSPCSPGERLRLAFSLTQDAKPIETEAEVIWCHSEAQHSPGLRYWELGISLRSLSEAESAALARFVEELSSTWPDP